MPPNPSCTFLPPTRPRSPQVYTQPSPGTEHTGRCWLALQLMRCVNSGLPPKSRPNSPRQARRLFACAPPLRLSPTPDSCEMSSRRRGRTYSTVGCGLLLLLLLMLLSMLAVWPPPKEDAEEEEWLARACAASTKLRRMSSQLKSRSTTSRPAGAQQGSRLGTWPRTGGSLWALCDTSPLPCLPLASDASLTTSTPKSYPETSHAGSPECKFLRRAGTTTPKPSCSQTRRTF